MHRWPLSTSEVATLLDIPEYRIRYQLRSGALPDAVLPLTRAGRLFWFPGSVVALIAALVESGWTAPPEVRATVAAAAQTAEATP